MLNFFFIIIYQPHSKLLTDLDNAEIEIVTSQSIADELKPEMYLQNFKVSFNAKFIQILIEI